MSGAIVRCLEAPPPGWESLVAADPNAVPSHRPELVRSMAAVLPGMTARFVAVEQGGALIGGTPFVIERRASFRWVHVLPFLLPGAPLGPGPRRAEVDALVAQALGAVVRETRAVGGEWVLYRPCGPEPDAAAAATLADEVRFLEASLIELDQGIEPAWRRLDRDTRSGLRRARLEGLRFGEDPEALEESYALHLAQSRRWPGHRPVPLELGRRLLQAPPESPGGGEPMARLFTVRAGGRLLTATLFLDGGRELFAWWSGSREAARARHAVPFLYWSAAEWAAARGRARLNLGGSGGKLSLEAFKRSFGARLHRYPVHWIGAGAGSWLGRKVAGLQGAMRRRRFRGDES